jgi:hypothetical protein
MNNPNISRLKGMFCSPKCKSLYYGRSSKLVICLNCSAEFYKENAHCLKSPKHFCSQSCSATYNNKHKKYGNRRSKLEIYIEEQLTVLYPSLHIDYNKKEAINSELDIYIPSLKLAFELNGIFHYEPIFGSDKMDKIKSNDISKSKSCIDKGIDLCVIDASSLKYFKPSNAQKYLDIVVEIVNNRIAMF